MTHSLLDFVLEKSFPCIMAKQVINKGFASIHDVDNFNAITSILDQLYSFIDTYRSHPETLSSFILVLHDRSYDDFDHFEKEFWKFLSLLNDRDAQRYPHDPRVGSHPDSNDFSFSIKSEAFFILALHPKSPRFARRFRRPAIVFNVHQQFEKLRSKGIFNKVRDHIRKRDLDLQGFANPMLKDFGERSEVFQYLGRTYETHEECPLKLKGSTHEHHSASPWNQFSSQEGSQAQSC